MPNIPTIFSTVHLILWAGQSQFSFIISVPVGKDALRSKGKHTWRPHTMLDTATETTRLSPAVTQSALLSFDTASQPNGETHKETL